MKLTPEIKDLFTLMVDDINLLTSLHDKELDGGMLGLLRDNDFPYTLGFALQSKESSEALSLLKTGVDEIKGDDIDKALEELAVDYADIYLNHSLNASPFESVWLDEENLMMQDAMFDIRKHYDKFSLCVENWRVRSDDHFICQLQFVAYLLSLKEYKHLQQLVDFMDKHLFRWFGKCTSRVAKRCSSAFYAGLAALTFSYIDELRDVLAVILEQQRPDIIQIEESNKSIPLETEEFHYTPGVSESW